MSILVSMPSAVWCTTLLKYRSASGKSASDRSGTHTRRRRASIIDFFRNTILFVFSNRSVGARAINARGKQMINVVICHRFRFGWTGDRRKSGSFRKCKTVSIETASWRIENKRHITPAVVVPMDPTARHGGLRPKKTTRDS